MENDETLELTYKFNDIYDEVLEDSNDSSSAFTRPLYDELSNNNTQYTQFEKLAQGGMKSIYKVFDSKLNRHVAYAKLRPQTPEEVHDPFIREARLTALMEHPNIISVYDIGVSDDDAPYFTMELKVGDNLTEYMRNSPDCHIPGQVEFQNLLESFIKVCDAISYAHSKNVLHLDLKPENIQLGQFGEVLVCDWGLGKIIGDKDIEYDQMLFNPDLLNNVTLTGKVVGTPGFMAPEQINLKHEKSFQTDIYALGSILYKIITGRDAFESEKLDEILQETLRGEVCPPKGLDLNWQVPISLSAVALKAMSLDPSDRYQSVEKLKREVQKYLNGRSTEAEHAGVVKELKLFYIRNRMLCKTAASFMALFIVLIMMFIFKQAESNKRLAEERDRAEFNRRMMSNERDSMFLEKDLATALLGKDKNKIIKVFEFTDYHIFKSPISAVLDAEKLLEQLNHNKRAAKWADMQKNHVYFISQRLLDFDDTYMKRSRNYDLVELIKELIYDRDIDLLEIDSLLHLSNFLLEKHKNITETIKILKYDGAMRPSQKDHARIVERLLQAVNPNWEKGEFSYDEKLQILKISGEDFKRFEIEPYELDQRGESLSRPVCLIDSLKFKMLDLSNSGVFNLWSIGGVNFEALDISNTKIKDLSPIVTMKQLDTLALSKGRFSQEELNKLPKKIKIVFK